MKPTNPWIVLICTLLFTYCLPSRAALVEDDFSVDLRRWIGDTSAFTLQHGELRTNSTKSHTRFFIATEFQGQQHMMWETTIRLDFATSSANFVDWVLHSDRSEIDGNYNGYFLRIGDKYDHIALYRRNGQQITLLAQTERDITHHFSGRIHCAFHNNGWSVYIKDDTPILRTSALSETQRLVPENLPAWCTRQTILVLFLVLNLQMRRQNVLHPPHLNALQHLPLRVDPRRPHLSTSLTSWRCHCQTLKLHGEVKRGGSPCAILWLSKSASWDVHWWQLWPQVGHQL